VTGDAIDKVKLSVLAPLPIGQAGWWQKRNATKTQRLKETLKSNIDNL